MARGYNTIAALDTSGVVRVARDTTCEQYALDGTENVECIAASGNCILIVP